VELLIEDTAAAYTGLSRSTGGRTAMWSAGNWQLLCLTRSILLMAAITGLQGHAVLCEAREGGGPQRTCQPGRDSGCKGAPREGQGKTETCTSLSSCGLHDTTQQGGCMAPGRTAMHLVQTAPGVQPSISAEYDARRQESSGTRIFLASTLQRPSVQNILCSTHPSW
jgi:hypothetical protein